MIKVCHVTSTHKAEDQRIFHKECVSLVNNGYDVHIIAQGDDHINKGVTFHGTGEQNTSSAYRLLKRPKIVYKKAIELDAAIYHLHDMELLPYALKLKRRGKKVIFDYHEDFALRFADSDVFHFPKWAMKLMALMYKHYEIYVFKRLDVLISVTPHICERLRKINPNTYMITNYPLINETWGNL